MPHSSRHVHRKSTESMAVRGHRSARNRSISASRDSSRRSRTGHKTEHVQIPSTIIHSRTYRYRRIHANSSAKSSDHLGRKCAYSFAVSILITLALIGAGLYIYYFVDSNSENRDTRFLTFSPTLFTTTVSSTTMQVKNQTEDKNGTFAESFEKDKNETTLANFEEASIGDAFYFSEIACIENERERECVAGSMADFDICSRGGSCTRVQYNANISPDGHTFDPELEHRPLNFTGWPAPNGTICKRKSDGLLGVCYGGQCLGFYNGTRKFYQIEGQWKDNCDRVNPCWTTPDTVPAENRTVCTKRPRHCEPDEQCENGATMGVVWMEHRYCYMNPARAGSYCRGFPFRLWLCRFCRGRSFPLSNGLELSRAYSMQMCLQKFNSLPDDPFAFQCIISCNDFTNQTVGNVVLPDGAVCLMQNNSTGFCYKGRCFTVQASLYEDKLRTFDECEKQKILDELKWHED